MLLLSSSIIVGIARLIIYLLFIKNTKFKVYNFGNSDSADHFYMTTGNLVAKQIRASKSFKRSISYIIEEKNVYLYEGVWKQ